MNKYLIFALALTAMTFAACSDDDDDNQAVELKPSTSAVVLNCGNWGGNDASIMRFDVVNNTVTNDLYLAANNEQLGDLGQDIIKYGSKYYVTVTESSKLVVLNKDMKIIKVIPFEKGGMPSKPRFMASANGKVYVTAYDSCISRIDTTSLRITGSVMVGDHPEGLSYANGKLYANISGYGAGSSVAVVDEQSFTKTKDLQVLLNPYTESVVADNGNVYIVSNGNYAGSPNLEQKDWVYGTVQCINTKTDEVSEVCRGTFISTYKNRLYVLYSEYYLPDTKKAFIYDLNTKEETTLTDINKFQSPQGINVDPTRGNVYVFDCPWGNPADICVIGADGTIIKKVPAGFATCKMIFE